jgi:hypothetical protein
LGIGHCFQRINCAAQQLLLAHVGDRGDAGLVRKNIRQPAHRSAFQQKERLETETTWSRTATKKTVKNSF